MAETRTPSIVLTSVLLTFSIVTNFAVALAQVPASAPGPSESPCFNTLLSLSPCLDFITGTGKTPGKDCCSAFKSVMNSNELCLCDLFTSNNPLGQPVDQKRAQAMSTACKVTTPPVSLCSAVGVPVSVPAPAAASGSASSPAEVVSPTGSDATNGTASPSPSEGSAGVSYNYIGVVLAAILAKFLLL